MKEFPVVGARADSSRPSVLVTGGAGYIGSHVVLACQEAGYPVVVLDDFSTGHRTAISECTPSIEANVADFDAVKSVIDDYRVTSVIHLAASTSIPRSMENSVEYYINNSMNSLHLIRACIEANVRNFIFSSTAAVYGIPLQIPVSEEARKCPINPYGKSKLMTEWMISDAASDCGFNYLIFRFFNVAGADPKGRTGPLGQRDTHLIKVAAEAAVGKRNSITVFGSDYETTDGSCIRDFIHVSDVADAHVAALRKMESEGDGFESAVLNCGYGFGASVFEVIEAVKSEATASFRVLEGPRRAGDPPTLVAEASLIRRSLDWSPCYDDLRSIIGSAIAWEQTHS